MLTWRIEIMPKCRANYNKREFLFLSVSLGWTAAGSLFKSCIAFVCCRDKGAFAKKKELLDREKEILWSRLLWDLCGRDIFFKVFSSASHEEDLLLRWWRQHFKSFGSHFQTEMKTFSCSTSIVVDMAYDFARCITYTARLRSSCLSISKTNQLPEIFDQDALEIWKCLSRLLILLESLGDAFCVLLFCQEHICWRRRRSTASLVLVAWKASEKWFLSFGHHWKKD